MDDLKRKILRLLPNGKKQWTIFTICLIISAFSWILITLSSNYENYFVMQLKYKNLPKDYVLVNTPPKKLTVNVRASGFELLLNSVGLASKKLSLNVAGLKKTKKGSSVIYYWVPKDNGGIIKSNLDKSFEVRGYGLDSVKLEFSKIGKKKVPVKINYEAKVGGEFLSVSEPLVSPPIVELEGAQSVLDGIDSVSTHLVKLGKVDANVDQDILLVLPKGVRKAVPDTVRLFMEVQPVREFTVEIKVDQVNVPDSLNFKLFPENVEITFSCGATQFAQVQGAFKAHVDYKDYQEGGDKLPVYISGKPNFVSKLKLSPAKVEYLINKK